VNTEKQQSPVRAGQLCISLAGRDRGKTYMVTGQDEGMKFVFLSDGCSRKVNNPKKKRLKHVKMISGVESSELENRIMQGKKVYDHEIARIIHLFMADKALLPHKEG
jgi:ribosomal protein L14E/L6E/L27E